MRARKAERTAELVLRDPGWPAAFGEIAAQITAVLGDRVAAVHHVGSTAMDTVHLGKPVIDILVEFNRIEDADDAGLALASHGFEARGEYGVPGRRYFVRPASEDRLRVHVHAFEAGHPEVGRHLGFRDYLLSHPDAAREYTALKRTLADAFPHDRSQYQEGKAPFIRRIGALAASADRSDDRA